MCLSTFQAVPLKITDVTAIITAGVALLTFLIAGVGAYRAFDQYQKDQKWKRKEFVYKLFEDFDGALLNRQAMAMLDWHTRYIKLAHSTDDTLLANTLVDDELLVSALRPLANGVKFTEAEARIRDIFDSFLTGLEKVETFIESGLLEFEDVKPHLRYRADLIAGKLHGNKAKWQALHDYIHYFGYENVQKLLQRFGRGILPTPDLGTARDLRSNTPS